MGHVFQAIQRLHAGISSLSVSLSPSMANNRWACPSLAAGGIRVRPPDLRATLGLAQPLLAARSSAGGSKGAPTRRAVHSGRARSHTSRRGTSADAIRSVAAAGVPGHGCRRPSDRPAQSCISVQHPVENLLLSTSGDAIIFKIGDFGFAKLTFLPFEDPVCTIDGSVFDLMSIIPYLKKFGKHPVTGAALKQKDLVPLMFHKNTDGSYPRILSLPGCQVKFVVGSCEKFILWMHQLISDSLFGDQPFQRWLGAVGYADRRKLDELTFQVDDLIPKA